jgi:hypothetical protein
VGYSSRGAEGFESVSLQRRVCCEPDFWGRSPPTELALANRSVKFARECGAPFGMAEDVLELREVSVLEVQTPKQQPDRPRY